MNIIGKLNLDRCIAVILLLLSMPGLAAAQLDSFDVPLKKKVEDFGPSP